MHNQWHSQIAGYCYSTRSGRLVFSNKTYSASKKYDSDISEYLDASDIGLPNYRRPCRRVIDVLLEQRWLGGSTCCSFY